MQNPFSRIPKPILPETRALSKAYLSFAWRSKIARSMDDKILLRYMMYCAVTKDTRFLLREFFWIQEPDKEYVRSLDEALAKRARSEEENEDGIGPGSEDNSLNGYIPTEEDSDGENETRVGRFGGEKFDNPTLLLEACESPFVVSPNEARLIPADSVSSPYKVVMRAEPVNKNVCCPLIPGPIE